MAYKFRLLVLHRPGWTMYGDNGGSGTARRHGYGEPGADVLASLVPGAAVVDDGELVEREPSLVVASPMADTRLAGRDCLRFADLVAGKGELARAVVDRVGATGSAGAALAGMARVAEAVPEFGGLDSVSVSGFVQWWKDRGARIGYFWGGSIQWESED